MRTDPIYDLPDLVGAKYTLTADVRARCGCNYTIPANSQVEVIKQTSKNMVLVKVAGQGLHKVRISSLNRAGVRRQ